MLFFMEIWKDIPGFGNRYQISDAGRIRVKSYLRTNGYGYYWTKPKILEPFSANSNHQTIVLSFGNKKKHLKIHRLVAMAFIPNPENKPEVDHINTNVFDNRVENLRWVTSKENKLNPITHERNKKANKYTVSVIGTSVLDGISIHFNSIKEAESTLYIGGAHICACCNGKRKTAGGYKWKYAI